jgi:hypothetical protein
MAFKLNTLHIFGYGETQVIGQDGETNINKKAPNDVLTLLQPVVDNVYSFKPAENPAINEYHAINIFVDLFSDYVPKDSENKSWRTQYEQLDQNAIDVLVAEVLAYEKPTQQKHSETTTQPTETTTQP